MLMHILKLKKKLYRNIIFKDFDVLLDKDIKLKRMPRSELTVTFSAFDSTILIDFLIFGVHLDFGLKSIVSHANK